MKVEPTSGRRHYLANETSIIEELPPAPFFSCLVAVGATDSHRFLVLEFLGRHSTRRGGVRAGTVSAWRLCLSFFMLRCLREFHLRRFVHHDVKPSNFLLTTSAQNPVALIDFGLARRFVDPETGRPFRERAARGFRGTLRYASLNAHC
jgi:serine/threonine protein kinase